MEDGMLRLSMKSYMPWTGLPNVGSLERED